MALSAIGALKGGESQKAEAGYNAQVSENAAATTRAQGTFRQEAQREQARRVIGQQLAAVGESGTGLSGSNLDALTDSLYNAELDALNIRYDSELNARGLQDQAALNRAQGRNAQRGSYLSAASSLLNSYSSYVSSGRTLNGAR